MGHEEYGLMIDQIKEVVLTPAITRMPQTPSYMKGVANIRGNVIAILDLANRFALTDAATNGDQYKYTLVVESEDLKMGLLVHEVPPLQRLSSMTLLALLQMETSKEITLRESLRRAKD